MKKINVIIATFICAFITTTTFAQSYQVISGKIECLYNGRWRTIPAEYVLRGSFVVKSDGCFTVKNTKTNREYSCAPSRKGGKLVDLIKIKCQDQVPRTEAGVVTHVPKGKEVSDAVIQQINGNFPVNFHYFLVGVHEFQNQHWEKLQDPTNNLEKFAKAIEQELVPENKFILSMHDVVTDANETSNNVILEKLALLSDSVKFHNNDMVLLYLSSHGMYDSTTHNFHFITSDSQISANTLNAYINKMTLKGAKVLVFVDACQSGALTNDLNALEGDGKCGYYMSSAENKKSFETRGTFYITPFVRALIFSVSGEELEYVNRFSTNTVTPGHLYDYIDDCVSKDNNNPKPRFRLYQFKEGDPLWVIKPDLIDSLKDQANNHYNYCAMVQLGDIYYYNYRKYGVSQDTVIALKYYRSAYNTMVNPMAACRLGMHYFYQTPEPDYDTAFKLFKESAEKGCDLGRYYMAVCYEKGKGVKSNRLKAKHYFNTITHKTEDLMKAYNKEKVVFITHSEVVLANQGKPLTRIIAFVPKGTSDTLILDPKEVYFGTDTYNAKEIQKSAQSGNDRSQAVLGDIYLNGKNFYKRDYQQAYHWYNESATKGNKDGLFGLGLLYMNGLGVVKDFNKAADCFLKSAEKRKANAYTKLASLYFSGGYGLIADTTRAIEYLEKAAKLNDVDGLYMMGLCYEDGIGVPQDLNKAYSCFYKSAKRGHAKSQYQVGKLLLDETFSKYDDQQAKKWLDRAIKQGDEQALELYNIEYYYGCPVRNN